jgi:hypothetical protein
MHYKDADSEYFEIVAEEMRRLFTEPGTTDFPNTYKAFYGFCAKTNSLKTALFDMVDVNNPYAFNALLRCLCEHYLKFIYIWVRFCEEKTDEAGVEYFAFCGATEAREYASALQTAEKLVDNDVHADVDEAIASMYPTTAGMSQKEVETKSGQFKYRAILRFLKKAAPEMVSAQTPFLAAIIPNYATLSSFVHGGPYTDIDMLSYSGPEALQECEERAGLAFLMTASVFMMAAAAVAREHLQHQPVAPRVYDIIKRFTASNAKDKQAQ